MQVGDHQMRLQPSPRRPRATRLALLLALLVLGGLLASSPLAVAVPAVP